MPSLPVDIISAYETELRAFIQSRLGNPADSEDLLQEVWVQLSRVLSGETLQNPRAWLYRVTRNKIIDHYRRQSPEWLEELLPAAEDDDRSGMDILPSDDNPEEYWFQEQFWESLYEALDLLPESQRLVFIRHELEGLTLREIAEQSGENLKTIISRKGYAIRHLRDRLAWLWEDFEEID